MAWLPLIPFLTFAQDSLPPAANQKIDFAKDIAPLLQQHCFTCHGPRTQQSGLRFDQKSAALKGSMNGPVIVPRNGAGSRMIQLVAGVSPDGLVMPPVGPRLTSTEVGLLRAWIDQGVSWPENVSLNSAPLWSLQKVTHPDPPAVHNRTWARNPIDNFLLAKLESQNIAPSPEAAKTTLIRRVSFDLTGLPPTPEEIRAFLADTRPDAYDRLVDRLLASPHYGERWGRYWLDLARYADSDGYEKDRTRPWAWRYRQWVIEAFNRDLPYDQFTIEQIAGDLLPHRTDDMLVATGFNRNTLTNREGGTDPEQFRDDQVLDRAATLGTVFLGLTVGCAQCHDHKFDPIAQKDFYSLAAFFNTEDEVDVPAPLPGEIGPWMAARPEYERKRQELLAQYKIPEVQADWENKLRYAVQHLGEHEDWDFAYGEFTHTVDNAKMVLFLDPAKRSELQQAAMTDTLIGSCGNLFPKPYCEGLKLGELRTKLTELRAGAPQISYAPVLMEGDATRKTFVHLKGDWRDHGDEVHPATPPILPPLPQGPDPARLRMARWLVSRDNPLAARVAVNRLWQQVFGRGIVNTSEDFGSQGDRPTHPELLDWLASEFMSRGWSMKQMVRLMVTSAAYRQSSNARPDLDTRDPDNTLLARQSALRLPAELIRDEALSAAELLDLRIGGRSVKPPQPKGVAELSYAGSVKWVESTGGDRYRRGMYIHFQRTSPYPQLMNFDAPSAELSCTRRERTDTPLQALNLMNDAVFFEAAQGLALRVMREGGDSFGERLDFAFLVTLGRAPSTRERERMERYFAQSKDGLAQDEKTVAALFPNRIEGVPQLDAAAWVELSRVMLNLDEFIARE
jgi:mono/diheme cytochrome c family protein